MFGNLAEDIWRQFRDDPRVDSDLDAVDKGSDTLVVTTRVSLKGRTLQAIHRLVKQYMMEFDVKVDAD